MNEKAADPALSIQCKEGEHDKCGGEIHYVNTANAKCECDCHKS